MGCWQACWAGPSVTTDVAGTTPGVNASDVRCSSAIAATRTTPAIVIPATTARALRIEALQAEAEREDIQDEQCGERARDAQGSRGGAQPPQRRRDRQARDADER